MKKRKVLWRLYLDLSTLSRSHIKLQEPEVGHTLYQRGPLSLKSSNKLLGELELQTTRPPSLQTSLFAVISKPNLLPLSSCAAYRVDSKRDEHRLFSPSATRHFKLKHLMSLRNLMLARIDAQDHPEVFTLRYSKLEAK